MVVAAHVMLGVVALLHGYFFVLEAVLWETPKIRRLFGNSAEKAAATKVMAQNQGVYNLFLAAGCAWAIACPDAATGRQFAVYSAGCVVVAAIVGAMTASKRILVIQGVPGAAALVLTLAS